MRRRVVAMLGQKGGSGKSTVGVSLAVEAIRAGKTVTIIDIDPQQTSSKWGDRRAGSSPTVVSAQAERLTKTLEGIDPDHLVIIDTAGKADREGIAVSKVADLILLPSRPLIADVETLGAISELLRLTDSRKKAYVLWNAAVSPTDGRIAEAAGLVEEHSLNICPHVIVQRVAVADALVAGMSAAELDPTSKAAAEMTTLYGWAMERLNG